MRASFILLAFSDLALLSLTAVLGLQVDELSGFHRHFFLGVLSGLFTCFVHVVLFVYFVVQDKIMKQSILHHALDAAFAPRVDALKSAALRLSMSGIGAVLLTVMTGAAIGVFVGPSWHLVTAFAGIGVNGLVFAFQYDLLRRAGHLFHEAFGEPA